MASSLVLDNVAESTSDNSLIVLINNDGTLTVDPKDLKSALENKKDAAISVVRVGRPLQRDPGGDSDDNDISHVNLTVEGFYSPSTASAQDFIDDLALEVSDEDVDVSSLSIVDPASDSIHIDHCYTNRLSNRQILQLSVGPLEAGIQAQLEQPDGVENCPTLRQDGVTRGKIKSRSIRGGFKDVGVRRSVLVEPQEASASALQRIVLKPPPNSPASATLVPLVKPLVLKQVARRGMSRGGGYVTVSGNHASAIKFLKPSKIATSAALVNMSLSLSYMCNFGLLLVVNLVPKMATSKIAEQWHCKISSYLIRSSISFLKNIKGK